jgi:tRNA threonylcarbamoyladenosine biosynthesis protein TsaB
MILTAPLLLYIETSTEVCSVAVSSGDNVICSRVLREPKSHARVIAPMVDEIMRELSVDMSNFDAVVVSEGPGSYTGLRVGVSLAKGLCFGSGKPLISVSSLDLLFNLAIDHIRQDVEFYIVPMIDARRMEVYTAVYDRNAIRVEPVQAMVIDGSSFRNYLDKGLTVFCGDGCEKIKGVIEHPNALFTDIESVAQGMVRSALVKFNEKRFEDVAYFEPFYLKDFIAGIPKKGIRGLS